MGCDESGRRCIAWGAPHAPNFYFMDSAQDFPRDADGDALRKLHDAGSDLSKPHNVDFYLCFVDENAARTVADRVRQLTVRAHVKLEEDGRWTCFCQNTMVPSYDNIVALDRRLEALCREFGGEYEGWGTMQVK